MSNGNEGAYSTICAQVNSGFDVRSLMDFIDWHPDRLVRSGDIFLALCPIHRDNLFRTLVLNPRNNTYVCKHVNCPGHRPADFLDLLVKVYNKSFPEVIERVVAHFGPNYFRLNKKQIEIIADMAREAREQQELLQGP